MRRKTGAPRGGGDVFEPISWEEALALFAEKIKGAQKGGAYAIVGDPGDAETAIVAKFLRSLNSSALYAPDFRGAETHRAALLNPPGVTSAASVPYYDLSQAAFALLLGADIFENSPSPVHYGWAYGQMRRSDPTHRGVMVYVGRRVSMTAASADRFIYAKAGSLGILSMGIAGAIVRQADLDGDFDHLSVATRRRWIDATEEYTPSTIYKRTQVGPADLAFLVEQFKTQQPGMAIPGDDVALIGDGVTSLKSVRFLNLVLQELARSKGKLAGTHLWPTNGDLPERMREAAGTNAVNQDSATFASAMGMVVKHGAPLGMIFNADPLFVSPPAFNVAEALSNTAFVVAAGLFRNETTRFADLLLPVSHFLESWGAQVPVYPWRAPIFNMQQPVILRRHDTRSFGDALIAARGVSGHQLGVTGVEPLIHELIEKFRAEWPEVAPVHSILLARESLLVRGGWWPEEESGYPAPDPDVDQLWRATENAHPNDLPLPKRENDLNFQLIPYHPVTVADGSLANLPWLLEMPEPMTTISWGSWVEIHPKTAMEIGVAEGDILRISSPNGSIEAPATLYPGTPRDAVAAPFGYGHTSFGRYATNRGANLSRLLGVGDEQLGGASPWRGLTVTVTKTGRHQNMPREAHPKGEYEGEVFQL
jgi:anaerobic selenocysteine-containing dehydrogenase